ncbi:MAG TPA: dihydrodipicolinate reductase C-terminal domain-containing protein [Thermoanaerobaculia bacterium]|nr:dihydrodipicolinate reductase C-terminal domain-containing protein [Thermoanaerobaculia bacterium]
MRIGIFGRGRLAGAVAEAAVDRVAWRCGRGERPGEPVRVAIDCSLAEAVEPHLEWALEHSTHLVIAVTGWRLDDLERRVGERIGVVVAPNGSLTVLLMTRLARVLGAFMRAHYGDAAGGYLLDHHHAAKRDAPSGTALRLAAAWREGAGEAGELAVSTLRAGHAAGTHVLGLDAPGEQLELIHRARTRAPFAQGLLSAADWIAGRRGLFTMDHVADAMLGPLIRGD